MKKTSKKHLQLAIGILISAVCLYFAFRNVEFSELWKAFKATNWLMGIVMVAVTMASFYWRTFRWQIFLRPIKEIPSRRLFPPLMLGFAFNNIYPARVGEFARPLALKKTEDVPYGAGLSTIILERLVDVLTLLVLLVTTPLYVQLDPDVSRKIAGVTVDAAWIESNLPKFSIMAGILLAGSLTFLIHPVKNFYIKVLHALPLISSGLKEKLEGFIEAFAKGFDSLRSPKAIFLTAIHSVIIWFSVAFTFQLMSWGFPSVELSFGQALAFLVVTCVVITLPSSPGFWGVYEVGGMLALIMMGVVDNDAAGRSAALAFTMVVHFLQWAPLTAYGLAVAVRLHISATEAAKTSEEKEEEIHHLAEEAEKEAGVESLPPPRGTDQSSHH